jgi:hypothetical protein
MTPLRRRIIDDMALHSMAPLTQQAYVQPVKSFSLFFGRSPKKLTFEEVRSPAEEHSNPRRIELGNFAR